MSDPRRLIDDPDSPEARLLASALNEPPPADLLARTLSAVGAGSAAGAATAGKAAGAVAGKAAGGGLVGAIAAGALAGVLTVGGYALVAGRAAPPVDDGRLPRSSIAPALPEPPVAPRAPATATPAPPSTDLPPAPPAVSAVRPRALATEIEILDDVRRALDDGNPVRAKALLDRYAREAPRGQLAREAAKLRAEMEAAPKPP